jgi:hypothetical protein
LHVPALKQRFCFVDRVAHGPSWQARLVLSRAQKKEPGVSSRLQFLANPVA